MQIPHEATLLRIYVGESDRWEHKPLYEAIVLKARELHLAGATVPHRDRRLGGEGGCVREDQRLRDGSAKKCAGSFEHRRNAASTASRFPTREYEWLKCKTSK